ncbi:hypothetical protein MNR02_08535 [Shinella sp. H4-D48]|uniref:hypothetical protein n=1 Tax=Shinella sp. H4-D48 TaxID=2925841 RepID=UPI001F53B279|nr:hypothetical protein [Shinella sp. H4-D48]UNK36560.1 hypothetical protein MNR02_08535 [Shinella sp. H4-D48]
MLMATLTSYEDDFRPMEDDRLVTIVVDGEARHWLMDEARGEMYPVMTYGYMIRALARLASLDVQRATIAAC